jgi:hypothetical protein
MAQALRFDPWSPPRVFPARAWLVGHLPFRVPPLRASSCPPAPRVERREMELQLLVSCLPPWLRALLVPTLRWEVKRRFPWSQERCAAGVALMSQRRLQASGLTNSSAAALRSMFISELEIGLTTIQTPLAWLSRPARNHTLAMRAARLGQLADALQHCPQAGPPEQEAEQVLCALRR